MLRNPLPDISLKAAPTCTLIATLASAICLGTSTTTPNAGHSICFSRGLLATFTHRPQDTPPRWASDCTSPRSFVISSDLSIGIQIVVNVDNRDRMVRNVSA